MDYRDVIDDFGDIALLADNIDNYFIVHITKTERLKIWESAPISLLSIPHKLSLRSQLGD